MESEGYWGVKDGRRIFWCVNIALLLANTFVHSLLLLFILGSRLLKFRFNYTLKAIDLFISFMKSKRSSIIGLSSYQ